jgi:pyruvyltransferase
MDFNNQNYIPTFWYLSNNFGDAVTHYLVQKISGKMPVYVEPNTPEKKVMVTGSILNNEVNKAIVWGCGIANENDKIPHHDIRAVRGKLLWNKLNYLVQNPIVIKNEDETITKISYNYDMQKIAIGDPCMLLPLYYKPKTKKQYNIGIIPHYIETKDFFDKINMTKEQLEDSGVLVIDVNNQIETFIEQVVSCETILSSSLHGIICADAYNIPSNYIKITNKVLGDGFKFKDWFSNFAEREFEYEDFIDKDKIKISDLIKIFQNPRSRIIWNNQSIISLQHLLETCPFK